MSESTPNNELEHAHGPTAEQTAVGKNAMAAAVAHVQPKPVGLVAMVINNLLGKKAALLGLAWIGFLLLLAVWAPVLANSHPFVWKHNGVVSSPWWDFLTATDLVLFTSFFVGVAMVALYRVPASHRFAAWVWLTALVTLVAPWKTVLQASEKAANESLNAAALLNIQVGLGAVLLLVVLVWLAIKVSASETFKCGVLVAGLVLALVLGLVAKTTSEVPNYPMYRMAQAAGEVEMMVSAPLPYSPNDQLDADPSVPDSGSSFLYPNRQHPMGATQAGKDVMSRMIHATRIALAIGLVATGIALGIGVVVGAVMGYAAGRVDLLGMRFVEIFSAIPVIFLLIMIVAFYGRSLSLMMIVIGATGWVGYALFVRAEFLKLRKADYVMAAKAVGVSLPGLLFRHMLPNGVTPVLVLASFGVGSAILYEAILSFLGLGLVNEPSWGQMLQDARSSSSHYGLVLYPGLAIFFTVLACNLVGDALREALDPKNKQR